MCRAIQVKPIILPAAGARPELPAQGCWSGTAGCFMSWSRGDAPRVWECGEYRRVIFCAHCYPAVPLVEMPNLKVWKHADTSGDRSHCEAVSRKVPAV